MVEVAEPPVPWSLLPRVKPLYPSTDDTPSIHHSRYDAAVTAWGGSRGMKGALASLAPHLDLPEHKDDQEDQTQGRVATTHGKG